jgi:hypothetical protein
MEFQFNGHKKDKETRLSEISKNSYQPSAVRSWCKYIYSPLSHKNLYPLADA